MYFLNEYRLWLVATLAIGAQLVFASRALGGAGSTTLEQPLFRAIELAPVAECLDEQRLENFVQLWLRRSSVPANVHVLVRPSPHRPRAIIIEMTQNGARRERRFDPVPEDCSEAHAALGLVIALALDAAALRRFAASDAGDSIGGRTGLVSVEAGGGYCVLPGASFGAKLGIAAEWLSWLSGRVDLLAHYSPNNALGPSAGRYDAMLFAASSQACMGGRPTEGLRLALCVGAAGGALHARGENFYESNADTGLWIAAVSTLRAELRIGIPWVIDLDLIAPLRVPSIYVEREPASDLVRHPDTAGLLIGLGPGLVF